MRIWVDGFGLHQLTPELVPVRLLGMENFQGKRQSKQTSSLGQDLRGSGQAYQGKHRSSERGHSVYSEGRHQAKAS
jgi:hypothetical protein